jgi:hypothetical protein
MKREDFINVAEETLDSLPEEFRSRIQKTRSSLRIFRRTNNPRVSDSKGVCF